MLYIVVFADIVIYIFFYSVFLSLISNTVQAEIPNLQSLKNSLVFFKLTSIYFLKIKVGKMDFQSCKV